MSTQNAGLVVRGSETELSARESLAESFRCSPIPEPELLLNLGLYTRATLVAKLLYLNELYLEIKELPGVVMEFGVWWGANLSLLCGLRSVHEPYNWTRKVVGFDSFEGYQSRGPRDGGSPYTAPNQYRVTDGYQDYLEKVLSEHERDNVLPHIRKFELVKGDVTHTAAEYFRSNPHTIVALAYLDLALLEPTKKCLEALLPNMVRGGIIAFDQLNCSDFPGETIALKETLGLGRYEIRRSKFLPDRSFLIVRG